MGLVPISPKTRPKDFIIPFAVTFILSIFHLLGQKRKIKTAGKAAVKFHSVALPNAYEVSCRARAWKYPIHIMEYAPMMVPPHPFLNGFWLLSGLNSTTK